MDKTYDDQPHHQIYASQRYEENLNDITNHKITWDDPSLYVQNACLTDPSIFTETLRVSFPSIPFFLAIIG